MDFTSLLGTLGAGTLQGYARYGGPFQWQNYPAVASALASSAPAASVRPAPVQPNGLPLTQPPGQAQNANASPATLAQQFSLGNEQAYQQAMSQVNQQQLGWLQQVFPGATINTGAPGAQAHSEASKAAPRGQAASPASPAGAATVGALQAATPSSGGGLMPQPSAPGGPGGASGYNFGAFTPVVSANAYLENGGQSGASGAGSSSTTQPVTINYSPSSSYTPAYTYNDTSTPTYNNTVSPSYSTTISPPAPAAPPAPSGYSAPAAQPAGAYTPPASTPAPTPKPQPKPQPQPPPVTGMGGGFNMVGNPVPNVTGMGGSSFYNPPTSSFYGGGGGSSGGFGSMFGI